MPGSESKLASVLIRHELAQREVKRLSTCIGESIAKCDISLMDYSSGTDKYRDEKGRTKTHLWHAFRETVDCEYFTRPLNKDDIEEYLIDEGCPHCLDAWRLMPMRKIARQELGAAKRAIRNIGRALLKNKEPHNGRD